MSGRRLRRFKHDARLTSAYRRSGPHRVIPTVELPLYGMAPPVFSIHFARFDPAMTRGAGGVEGMKERTPHRAGRRATDPAARRGLAVGVRLFIIAWLLRRRRNVRQVHPGGDEQSLTGLFATRPPDRPNPLGLHPVRVLVIDGRRLRTGPIHSSPAAFWAILTATSGGSGGR
jgi:tRNA-methyltransferase O